MISTFFEKYECIFWIISIEIIQSVAVYLFHRNLKPEYVPPASFDTELVIIEEWLYYIGGRSTQVDCVYILYILIIVHCIAGPGTPAYIDTGPVIIEE